MSVNNSTSVVFDACGLKEVDLPQGGKHIHYSTPSATFTEGRLEVSLDPKSKIRNVRIVCASILESRRRYVKIRDDQGRMWLYEGKHRKVIRPGQQFLATIHCEYGEEWSPTEIYWWYSVMASDPVRSRKWRLISQ
jgi:hypothetical protein